MNGYDLAKVWYEYRFMHPEKFRAIHSDLYFYIIHLWNNLAQKDKFGLPTAMTMTSLNIGSYHTYKSTFDDLVKEGFITVGSAVFA